MLPRSALLFVAVLGVLFLIYPALAHVPLFVEDSYSIENAFVVENPTKSWVIYGSLPSGPVAQYVQFHMEEGERIYATLQVSQAGSFVPGMVLIGPGINETGTVPPYVTVPDGDGAIVVPGTLPDQPAYEPFTPSKLYELADIDMPAPATGNYSIAVYTPSESGNYALALGFVESYGIIEWILVPIDVVGIHLWEGQSALLIFAPLIASLVIGLILILWRGRPLSAFAGAGMLVGLVYIGTGGMMLLQIGIASMGTNPGAAVILTLVFAIIPILLGVAALVVARRERIGARERIYMVVLGILGLFAWAGLVAGALLAIIAGEIPSRSRLGL